MNEGLDKYLQAVAAELRHLPPNQRAEEVREMRQHLEAIIARLVEGGLTEAEATEAACAQFGAARKVGRELEKAGAGREPWWRIVLAALCSWVCLVILCFVGAGLINWIVHPGGRPHHPQQQFVWAFGVGWVVVFASGMVAGLLGPRKSERVLLCLCSALPLAIAWQGQWAGGSFSIEAPAIVSGVSVGLCCAQRRAQRRTDAQQA